MKLYGKGGRSFRCLWMLEEAGIDYEHVLLDWSAGESRTPEFLAINPNGKIPVLVDDDLRLFESLAINYHLARNYAVDMWFNNSRDESLAIQWLAWGLGELEGPHDAANRGEQEIDVERLHVSLNALRQTLSNQSYILGDKFTVVDLNTASLLLRPQYRKVTRDDHELREWFRACTHRPALERATAKTV
ncbi:MAG: glutathione S-transferase family protein [Pseudomonadota bacterium]